jgi:hypothetical protein
MKTKLILGSLLALGTALTAQNTFPPSGNVGINNLSPAYNLDIEASSPSNGIRIVRKSGTIGAAGLTLDNQTTGGKNWSIFSLGDMDAAGAGNFSIFHNVTPSSGNHRLFINGTSGNVGIGTTTPDLSRVYANYDITPLGQGVFYYGVKGTIQSVSPIPGAGAFQTMTGVAGISSSGYSDEGFATGVYGKASNSRWNIGGDFEATGNGAYDNVGVHATASGNSNPSKNWAARFDGAAYCTASAWTSDLKLKQNIAPISGAAEKLMQLKPCSYNFKTDEDLKDMQLPQEKQMGLIAQDLQKVFPELIKEMSAQKKFNDKGELTFNTPDFKAVQYIGLIPVLIAGFQEQHTTIAAQQKQLDEQKQLIDALTQKASGTTGINTINTIETGFQMSQNEPNPFTYETVVKYTLPTTISNAFMAVYDLTGKQITTFPINERGSASVVITSEKLSAGIYIYSIVADGNIVDSKRMIVAEK